MMEGKLMNGTYVNGLKLGKGKQHSLDQGDTISMLQMDFEVAPSHSETAAEALKQKIMTGPGDIWSEVGKPYPRMPRTL